MEAMLRELQDYIDVEQAETHSSWEEKPMSPLMLSLFDATVASLQMYVLGTGGRGGANYECCVKAKSSGLRAPGGKNKMH